MDLQNIIILLGNQNVLFKAALIVLLLLFLPFTFILARQISVLTKLVNQVAFSPVLRMISYGIALATLVLLLITIFV